MIGSTPQKQIAVIGAGLAGLAAATRLSEAGYPVTVFEARDRPGGRVNTGLLDGLPVELGAGWLHGIEGNPVAELAQSLGLERRRYEADWAFWSRAEGFLDPSSMEALERGLERCLRGLEDRQDILFQDITAAEGVEALVSDASPELRPWLRFALRQWFELDYAGPLERQSFLGLDQDLGFSGGDWRVVGGLSQIPQALAASLHIRYETPVREVRYGKEVILIGDGWQERADRVVITAPLGALKAGRLAIELPQRKRQALERLAMGSLEVCYGHLAMPVGDGRELFCMGEELPNIGDLREELGAPVVASYAGGEAGAALGNASLPETLERLGEQLAAIHQEDVSVVSGLKSHWVQDEWAGGSYSHVACGASFRDMDALAEPIGRQVHFAGEHTIFDYHGTMHGAWLSGLREADRILAS